MIYDRLFSCQFVGNVAGSVRRSAHCRVVLRWFLYHVFSVGAVCSAIVAPFAGIYVQLGVFILISALSVVMVRPLALKYLHRHDDVRVSNADAIIDRTGTVSQAIPVGGYGRVALDGDDWKACSSDTEELPAGTMVKIIDRESVIVKVTKLK